MTNKLIMVDFWSYAGPDGKPVGHGCKVGNEYYEYVKDDFEVRHYINESMMPYIDDSKKVSFDASITYGLVREIGLNKYPVGIDTITEI